MLDEAALRVKVVRHSLHYDSYGMWEMERTRAVRTGAVPLPPRLSISLATLGVSSASLRAMRDCGSRRKQYERHRELIQECRLIVRRSMSAIRISRDVVTEARQTQAFCRWLRSQRQSREHSARRSI
jgi:hypothetical protein